MGKDGKRDSVAPPSQAPETQIIDASWDDEVVPAPASTDEAGVFDRVTAVPSSPAEDFVMRIMAEADAREAELLPESGLQMRAPPGPLSPPKVPVVDYVPPLPSAPRARPPRLPRRPPKDESVHAVRTPVVPAPDIAYKFELDEPGVALDTPPPPFDADAPEIEISEVPLDAALAAALDAENDEPSGSDPEREHREMRDRYATGDYAGALVIAESVLEANPADSDAERVATSCREVLIGMYVARLGSLKRVATLAIPTDEIRWLSLDHRAGFLLSLVDGISSIEEILDISGMSRLDALRIVCVLLDQRVIALAG